MYDEAKRMKKRNKKEYARMGGKGQRKTYKWKEVVMKGE